MWNGRKPNLANLRFFGCTAFAKELGQRKNWTIEAVSANWWVTHRPATDCGKRQDNNLERRRI